MRLVKMVRGKPLSVKVAERFWSKVVKTEGCWFWTGATTKGYGTVRVGGRMRYSAQVAWELFHGEAFPEGMQACHVCDTPLCVNPSHVFPGTRSDNMRDSSSKGRLVRFGVDRKVKLNDCKAADIRSRYSGGDVTQLSLALEYGVSETAVRSVVNGRSWRAGLQRDIRIGPVFVFGSNEAGLHGAGAARYAWLHYGAQYGKGFGHVGNSFAIPTKDKQVESLPLSAVSMYVQNFLRYALEHPELEFLVTRIGCGLAGFTDAEIGPLFSHAPMNCILPREWKGIDAGWYTRRCHEHGNSVDCSGPIV